jgi:F0F1-type ATP synthase assembly protein I
MDDSRQNLAYALSLGMQFGLMVAGTLALFLLGGVYLDKFLRTKPLFMILGIVMGFIGAGMEVRYVVLPFLEKRSKNKK